MAFAPEPATFRIAWICPLNSEADTLQSMLEQPLQYRGALSNPSDPNTYILGQFHGHNVVVLSCLTNDVSGGWSKISAHLHEMCKTFVNIAFGFVVGTGGIWGPHSASDDIVLGDVTLGRLTLQETWIQKGGRKTIEVEEKESRVTWAPSNRLREAVEKLRDRALALAQEHRVHRTVMAFEPVLIALHDRVCCKMEESSMNNFWLQEYRNISGLSLNLSTRSN